MSSSSEFLLCQQEQDELRRRKLNLLTAAASKLPQSGDGGVGGGGGGPLRKPWREQASFYTTIVLAVVAMSSGSSLLFLVPLYVDPAISTLASEFVTEPVICTTIKREELIGLANCSWSSCREGCTSDAYHCIHIYVTYNDTTLQNHYPTISLDNEAILLVNIKGCGYPPKVLCANFTNTYGSIGTEFPCYQSRQNRTVVLTHYQRDEQISVIIHFFVVPFIITFATSMALCCMHCECGQSNDVTIDLEKTGNLSLDTQRNYHQQSSSDESLSVEFNVY